MPPRSQHPKPDEEPRAEAPVEEAPPPVQQAPQTTVDGGESTIAVAESDDTGPKKCATCGDGATLETTNPGANVLYFCETHRPNEPVKAIEQ